jgi:hypothetical protein
MIEAGRGFTAFDGGMILATIDHGRLARSLKKPGMRSVSHA